MKIYVYTNRSYPHALLVQWQYNPQPLACLSAPKKTNQNLRILVRSIIRCNPTGFVQVSSPASASELAFPVSLAMQPLEGINDLSVMILGTCSLEGKLLLPEHTNNWYQVAKRYKVDMVLTAMDAPTTLPLAHKVATLADALREILSFHPADNRRADPFQGVHGLDKAKEALCLAIANRANLLLIGPPGCGKTLLLSKVPLLAPTAPAFWLKPDQKSLALGSIDIPSLIGGGFLFADELSSLHAQVRKELKTAMDGNPDFQVFAAMNLCPCGGRGLKDGSCVCSDAQIKRYWNSIGYALLDRFPIKVVIKPTYHWDIHIDMPMKNWEENIQRCLSTPQDPAEIDQIALTAGKIPGVSLFTARRRMAMASLAMTLAVWNRRRQVGEEDLRKAADLVSPMPPFA